MPVNSDVAPCEESDCDTSLPTRPVADGCGSPGTQRRKRLCKLRDSLKCRDNVDVDRSNSDTDNIYTDNLPEVFSVHTQLLCCMVTDTNSISDKLVV